MCQDNETGSSAVFNMGMPELIVIFIVALIVFGPKKLPELGKSLGRAMGEFKRSSQEFRDSLESEVEASKIKEDLLRQQKEVRDSLVSAGKTETPAADNPAAKGPAGETQEKSSDTHAG